MPVDAHSHCGERSSLREPSNLCERPREKNKKGCRRISLQKPAPLPGPGQAAITDNTFRISQREVIYPSQGRPMTAVMLCGRAGYAMMSFQRRNQRLASVWGGLVVLVFFKLCLNFLFFSFIFAFKIHPETFPNQISLQEPSLPTPSFPVVPCWRRALDPYWEMGRSHGLLSATETSLATAWITLERVSFSAPPPEMSEKNKTHCVTVMRHILVLFIL